MLMFFKSKTNAEGIANTFRDSSIFHSKLTEKINSLKLKIKGIAIL
jgi:hypothetical protein